MPRSCCQLMRASVRSMMCALRPACPRWEQQIFGAERREPCSAVPTPMLPALRWIQQRAYGLLRAPEEHRNQGQQPPNNRASMQSHQDLEAEELLVVALRSPLPQHLPGNAVISRHTRLQRLRQSEVEGRRTRTHSDRIVVLAKVAEVKEAVHLHVLAAAPPPKQPARFAFQVRRAVSALAFQRRRPPPVASPTGMRRTVACRARAALNARRAPRAARGRGAAGEMASCACGRRSRAMQGNGDLWSVS